MKNNDGKINKFLGHLNTPLSEVTINKIYVSNKISYEKCQLFNDYVQSQLHLIFDTYMGDDIMSDADKVIHFDWCWEKNRRNFNKEGITFGYTEESYDYFMAFIFEVFYSVEDKTNKTHIHENIKKIWGKIFYYSHDKTYLELDNLIGIYTILDKSLKYGQKKLTTLY